MRSPSWSLSLATLASLLVIPTARAEVVWRGGLEPGDLSEWNEFTGPVEERVTIVDDPVRDGMYAARIEIRLRMRPMGRDVLQDLVASGHLDAAVLAEMPTFTLFQTVATPDPASRSGYIVLENQTPIDETGHLCLLHGGKYCPQ